ncbi:D-amino acid aminotransferase [Thalassoglobus polymorphus]|uniref:D-alanine aminotransferase n=1 Tax=Thalassoglobus polymorphus TaxID=2527994 RepID=A0A517QUB4_9PLAN|nr:D-amino acid aminotransferase [Thalassoglobus polymorphus]QDT35236.1 D-alanine aminotransferase [Thalassoglobus polymorphus]
MYDPDVSQMFDQVPLANWNGTQMPLSEAKVSVLDRAFLFGDAIYEVLRVYGGKPFLFDDHIARLKRNFEKLQLPADADIIAQRVRETVAASDVTEGTVYIQVTRGVAPRIHRYPTTPPTPSELIYVAHFKDPYQELRKVGARVIILEDLRWKRCDIKSVNLLANCMAAQTAYEAGCPEALLVDGEDRLIEGSRTSLFGVRDGRILTAPLGQNILPGITRKLLIQLAGECNVEISEATIHRDDLPKLDELFITGTTTEILPITQVEDQTIGDGTVGPVVSQLITAYARTIERFRQS